MEGSVVGMAKGPASRVQREPGPVMPPCTNRGGTLPGTGESVATTGAIVEDRQRFDWYQVTVREGVRQARECLLSFGDEVREAAGLARMYRYEQGWEVWKDGQGPVCRVLCGGQGGTLHAWVSGEHTDGFCECVRAEFPAHLVTRADSAQDFQEVGGYDRMRSALRGVAAVRGVSFMQYADDLDESAGRTQYIGKPASDCRVRLYEKGKQVVQGRKGSGCGWLLNTVTGEWIPADAWVRLEAQVRPRDEQARVWLAQAEPWQVWGCSPWLRDVAAVVLGLRVERMVIQRRRDTSLDQALRAMVEQYGRSLSEKARQVGGWEEVGEYLRQCLEAVEEEKRTGRHH